MNPSEDWRDFINKLFVNSNGKRKSAIIGLRITTAEGELQLPDIEVSHTNTLQEIFLKVHRLSSINTQPETVHERTSQSVAKTINVEHIFHGNTEYIVYRRSDDSFDVVKLDGTVMEKGKVIFNTVVKKYREKFGMD